MRFFERIAMFMQGRYGSDNLNRFLYLASFILIIVSIPVRWIGLPIIVFALIALEIFRSFSRNHARRYAENQIYLKIRNKVIGFFRKLRGRGGSDPYHRIFKCPYCRKKLRVPTGRGTIQIHCPSCNGYFIKRT